MSERERIAEHLKFFAELGVEGVSRDPRWRVRPCEQGAAEAPQPAGEAVASTEQSDPAAPSAPSRAVADPVAEQADPRAAAKPASPPADPVAERADSGAAAKPAPRTADPAAEQSDPGAAAGPAPPPAPDAGAAPIPSWTSASLWDAPAGGGEAAGATPAERLRSIRDELGDCTRCKLHGGRSHLVFGVGRPDADLMFVGEAPGRDEDRQGEPFVGRAGQLLTKIIEAIDLRREDVYIANVIKCRPPQNRNPERDEVETCRPFLFAQIDAIQPRVIVALGSFAVRTLLDDDRLPISRARGQVYACRGAKLIPTFHPAFLLRSPDRKRDVWEDMKRVRSLLRGG